MTSKTAGAALAGTFTIGGDLTVHRLGFGAMRITGRGIWGPPPDREIAIDVLRRAVAAGINFIDTADSYGPEVSEQLIAEALYPYPHDVVVATKGGLIRPGPGDWTPDGRPQHLREALEGSLKRLRLERIDLYQLHRPDPKVPYEESVGALAELQKAGKIRHVGVSNVTIEQLAAARKIVDIVSVQNRFNFEDVESEPVLDICERDGLAFLPWAPIGGISPLREAALKKVATAHAATVPQVALAWLLAENIAAAGLHLGDDELRELTAS
jgi:pyridoxine 4-dehydrogenase